jgi:signal transduction histidine kinase
MCLIVMDNARSGAPRLYRSDSPSAKTGPGGRIDLQLASCLLELPEQAVLYNRRGLMRQTPSCSAYDRATLEATPASAAPLAALANLLEVDSFVSVPLRSHGQLLGRVHVASRGARYDASDLRLLAQLLTHAGVMIENLQLVDRLAVEVAARERRRISRDLHDGTIQPYIGLKLGLEALRRNLPADSAAREVDELIDMAADSIAQLRHYVGSLERGAPCGQGGALLPAVRRQARKFSEHYGIGANVVAESEISVTGKVYDDVILIVREGLSNIRRHTNAQSATVKLYATASQLRVELINDRGGAPDFFPRSIGERARELGGGVKVEQREGRHTAVVVELPL